MSYVAKAGAARVCTEDQVQMTEKTSEKVDALLEIQQADAPCANCLVSCAMSDSADCAMACAGMYASSDADAAQKPPARRRRRSASTHGIDFKRSGYTQFCPVLVAPQDEFGKCVQGWRDNDKLYTSMFPEFLEYTDAIGISNGTLILPIGYSTVGGSDSFGVNLRSTEDYLGLIVQSRKLCDEAEGMMPLKRGPYDKAVDKVHCFMYGIPYNYWGQYLTIEAFLYGTVGYALLASVVVSCVFLVLEQRAAGANWASVFVSAIFGSAMVIIVLWLTVMTVIGLLGWANIPQSAITAMTCLMSIAFSTEYAVHVTHHFVEAAGTPAERGYITMTPLFLPLLLAFLSSFLGIIVLAFSTFGFCFMYVFKPLIICVCTSYFYGAFFLPVLLQACAFLKLIPKPPPRRGAHGHGAPAASPPNKVAPDSADSDTDS